MYSAVTILALVIALVLWRPRGLSVAWPAAGGAVLMLVLGIVSYADVELVVRRTWNAALALVGLMVLSSVLEANGAFRAAAHRVAVRARGDGKRLFYGLALLTAAATAALANDGAILILTPIVADLGELVALPGEATLAYLFATGFLCDALSTLLPTSNLTNLLLVDTLHLHAGAFFLTMLAPWLVTLAVAVGVLRLQLGRRLPRTFELARLGAPPRFSGRSARASGTALALLLVGYGLASFVRLPLGVVVATVAAGLAFHEHRAGAIDARECLRALPWSIVVFATALFIVVTGVAQAGLDGWVRHFAAPDTALGIVSTGAEVSLLTSAVNNLPMFLMVILGLAGGKGATGRAYGALIGADVGCKLTPIGSLATLLWMEMLKQRRLGMSWRRYLTMAALPTVAATAAALLVLAAESKLF